MAGMNGTIRMSFAEVSLLPPSLGALWGSFLFVGGGRLRSLSAGSRFCPAPENHPKSLQNIRFRLFLEKSCASFVMIICSLPCRRDLLGTPRNNRRIISGFHHAGCRKRCFRQHSPRSFRRCRSVRTDHSPGRRDPDPGSRCLQFLEIAGRHPRGNRQDEIRPCRPLPAPLRGVHPDEPQFQADGPRVPDSAGGHPMRGRQPVTALPFPGMRPTYGMGGPATAG